MAGGQDHHITALVMGHSLMKRLEEFVVATPGLDNQ